MLYFKTNPAPNIDLCIQHHFSCEAKALKRSVFHMAARNCSHPLKFEIFSSKNAKCKWRFGKIDPRAWCQGKHIWSNFELLPKHRGTWVRILIFESYGKSYDGYQCPMLNICPILFWTEFVDFDPFVQYKNDSIQYLIQNYIRNIQSIEPKIFIKIIHSKKLKNTFQNSNLITRFSEAGENSGATEWV